ncbi:MAG TPA: class I adenylate-forming enzyme family protein [Mycobacteriales bacterium]|nr:class I adenylate-forming enzyme family protein [Mycobacteriales bacterium]
MRLSATAREAAERFGDRIAVVDPDGRNTTYAGLDAAADRIAAGLVRRGVVAGQLVALHLPPSAAHVAAMIAVDRVGAVNAAISPSLPDADVAVALDVLQPDHLLTAPDLADFAGPVTEPPAPTVRRPPNASPRSALWQSDGPTTRHFADVDREGAAIVVLTSGTTGRPKGAVFGQEQLDAITAIDVGDGWGGGTHVVVATGLAHIGFAVKVTGHLRRGDTLHLLQRWRAADVLRLVQEHRIPVVGGVAAQVALLLAELERGDYDVSSVQLLVVGAGPSPRPLVEQAKRAFGAGYSIRYSMTESGGLCCAGAPDDEGDALATVGRPRPGFEIELRDEVGALVGAGEVGRIWIRSPTVMRGYWRDPDATAQALHDGWLRTSDLGRWQGGRQELASGPDEAPRLVVVGRADDVFIRGGYNVHPLAVEQVLGAHPAVAQVAVAPRPDDVMGQVGVAVVVAAAPLTLAELRAFAAPSLAKHALPEDLVLVDALPLTAGQKLDRAALARLVAP